MDDQTTSGSSPSASPRSKAGPKTITPPPLPRCSSPAARGRPATQLAKTALALGDKVEPRGRATLLRGPTTCRIVVEDGAARPRHRLLRARGERLARARRQVSGSRLWPAGRSRAGEAGSVARALQRQPQRDAPEAAKSWCRITRARRSRPARSRAGGSSCSISTIRSSCSSCRCRARAACG